MITSHAQLGTWRPETFTCSADKRLDYLTAARLAETLAEGEVAAIRRVGAVFGDIKAMALSFPAENAPATLGLSIVDLRSAYQKLHCDGPPRVVEVAIGALARTLAEYRARARAWARTPTHSKPVLAAFEWPDVWTDARLRDEVLAPALGAYMVMPSAHKEALLPALRAMTADTLRERILSLVAFVKYRASPDSTRLPGAARGTINQDRSVSGAVRLLGSLFLIDQARPVPTCTHAEFVVPELLTAVDYTEDFTNWKRGSLFDDSVRNPYDRPEDGAAPASRYLANISDDPNCFSFIDYPFILSTEQKAKVLHIESLISQDQERRAAINSHLLHGDHSQIPVLRIQVDRTNLVETSLNALSRHNSADLKKELRVAFRHEEAVDEGGVQNEWFQLIVKEIFDPSYGMFIYDEDTRQYWFSRNGDAFLHYRLVGQLVGMAIFNAVILDLHFPSVVYKRLLGHDVTFDDLREVNPDMAQGFERLLEMPAETVEDAMMRTFVAEYEVFGETREAELKPGGSKISLTGANRQEYVDLYVQWLLVGSIEAQWSAFYKGFSSVCDGPAFRIFQWDELELLLCGSDDLDLHALEAHTTYESGFTKDSPSIRLFWKVVHSFDVDDQRKLLHFVTGSDRAPIGGLGKLQFVIQKHGDGEDEKLPTAHTCVAEGTQVTLAGGASVPVESVEVGSSVVSLDAAKVVCRDAPVVASTERGLRSCLEVTVSSGQRVELTGDHRVPVFPSDARSDAPLVWRTADTLVPGDSLLVTSPQTAPAHAPGALDRATITSIVPVGLRRVHDLAVQGTRSFVANGIVVSNCFNVLLLPPYSTELKMRDKLRLSIEHSKGFGML